MIGWHRGVVVWFLTVFSPIICRKYEWTTNTWYVILRIATKPYFVRHMGCRNFPCIQVSFFYLIFSLFSFQINMFWLWHIWIANGILRFSFSIAIDVNRWLCLSHTEMRHSIRNTQKKTFYKCRWIWNTWKIIVILTSIHLNWSTLSTSRFIHMQSKFIFH